MALTTYNITGSLKDALGGSSLIGEVTFAPYGTHDARVDGADALLGPIRYALADLPDTVSLSAGGWVISIRSTGRVNGDQQFKTITRTLDLTGPLTWGEIVAGAVSSPPMTPTLVEEAQAAAAEAEMWSAQTQTLQETAVTTMLEDPASGPSTTLSASYVATADADVEYVTPSTAVATYAPLTRPARMHVLGDSLSQNGLNLSMYNVDGIAVSDSKNPWVWGSVISGGRIRLGTIAATGGYTSTQIKATHLPTVLADVVPGDKVAILAGTNDGSLTGGIGGATSKQNLADMYAAVTAAGGVPVACTIPPATGDSAATAGSRAKLNFWIEQTARANGYPFLDFYKALVNPATAGWTTGLNNDNVHPNGGGCRAMGQLVADELTGDSPEPFLAAYNIGTGNMANPADGLLKWGNACMLTDTTANGRADQFEYGFGTLSGGSAFELVTVPGVVGKMQKVTRGATGPDNLSAITGYYASGVPGNRYYVAFKFKIDLPGGDPVISSSTKAVFQIVADGVGAVAGITEDGWDFSTPGVCTWVSEFTMPPGGSGLIMVTVGARGGNVSAYMGQLTIIDLTAQGVA